MSRRRPAVRVAAGVAGVVALLAGCGPSPSEPRDGAVEDFGVVVQRVEQVDGVASADLHDTDDATSGAYISGTIEVEPGQDPVEVLDAALRELYWFGAEGPRSVLVAAVQDGARYTLQGPLGQGERTPYVQAAEMRERYGP